MNSDRILSFLVYCTLSKEEYEMIRPMIWKRNMRILTVTSLLAAVMGGSFLIVNLLTHATVWKPYAFLLCSSMVIFLLQRLLKERERPSPDLILCYAEMLFICLYAGILSTQESNYAIPATSIIVFISILPLTIDDRPVRMYAVMLTEAAAYLIVSHFYKAPSAFSLDVLNVATFCVVGMILYAVICIRNVREIYQSMRVENIQQAVITSLATVVEERDENTGGHITRTEQYVSAIIDRMKRQEKYSDIPEKFYHNVILAAPLHDVGKIRIPDSILNKPGRLTEEEFEIMKKHAAYGAEIIQKTFPDVEEEEYYTVARNIARYHHERFDGKGYPEGLKGEEIPIEARIMSLADVYDALISERVYKKAFSKEKARAIIEEGSGTQFDPDLTALFLRCID
jgi:HD-GYP domain-containing protein (c-di-GMP phosphodiesterase class II)